MLPYVCEMCVIIILLTNTIAVSVHSLSNFACFLSLPYCPKKEWNSPCAGAPERGLFLQYKSALPPQESDLAGTNE